jgi:hypothetical protein
VLPEAVATELGLKHPTGRETCVVVVTHDCDLACDDLSEEPNVELIVGTLTSADGNYRWSKSPRTLHVDVMREEKPVVVELVATSRALVSKERMAAYVPDGAFAFSPQARNILRAWLAVRYNRAAFPDAFVQRMRELKLDEKLAQALKEFDKLVSAAYFVVDGGVEQERKDGSAYELGIVLAYQSGTDADEASRLASAAEKKVSGLFRARCYDSDKTSWSGVKLLSCIAISEDDFRVSQAKRMTQWRLEHMSLKTEEGAPKPLST